MKIIVIPNTPSMQARHYTLSVSLIELGHEVFYFTWEQPYGMNAKQLAKHILTSTYKKSYEYKGIPVVKPAKLPLYWPYINGWLFRQQLRNYFRKINADFIFSEAITNEITPPKNLPVIYDLADDYAAMGEVYGSKVYKFAFKLFGVKKSMVKQARHSLAVTGVTKTLTDFAKRYNPNVSILNNGVDVAIIREINKSNKNAVINKHSLIYVSGFGPWSRVEDTMQAVRSLRKEFPDIQLSFVGDGIEVPKIMSFIEKYKAQDYMHYLGRIDDRYELFEQINQNAIGLNISEKNKWRNAAQPIKVLEYSALGKKVVSTNLKEVINYNFPNVHMFDDKKISLKHALQTALTDKRTEKDFKSTTNHILNNFSWGKSAKDLVKIYETHKKRAVKGKIVHVTPAYPPQLGGLEKVVEILANKQKESGLNVEVITPDVKGFEPKDKGILIKRLWYFKFANTKIMPGLIWQLLKLNKNDIVHFHYSTAFIPEVVWLISKIKRYKYVAHMHIDFIATTKYGVLLNLYKPLVLKPVLRSANSVIVFTKDQQKDLYDRYGLIKTRVKVIPNGVEDKFFYSGKKTLHKKPRLLFVGRLNIQKNLPLLLESLVGISQDFETTIVGEGELKADLKSQVKKLGLKNVHFVGRFDGDKLVNKYREADVFVLPSEREGMPLVLLEALASGLPTVATNVTGSRDVISNNNNGLLVPYNDVNTFQNALIEVTDPKIFQRLSRGATESATQYSWSKVSRRIAQIYENI